MVQAKTPCGEPVGPSVDVEVVNCDDETKAKLAEEARIATEIIKEQLKQLEEIINSEEYKKASGRIIESAANLALKTSGLIFGVAAGAPGASGAVDGAGKVFGAGSALLDLFRSGNLTEAGVNTLKMGIELFGSAVMQGFSGAEEAYKAAVDFGEDLGVVEGATEKMDNARQWIEHWTRYIDDLIRRQKLCESGADQQGGQNEPSQEPIQRPAEPGTDTPAPPTGETPAAEPGGNEPSAKDPAQGETAGDESPDEGEPGGEGNPGDGGEVTPPRAGGELRQGGLPSAPGECGCNNNKTLEPSGEVFSTLNTGISNLGKCVGDFKDGPLAGYVKTLGDWKTVTDELTTAVGLGKKGIEAVVFDAIPRMDSLLQQTNSFDLAGQEFLLQFEKCPESVSSALDVLKSALTVTVDSIKTKY